ncbi:MAG: NYN domain-containing protein [Dehalococcoidia bacterium]|nr:NYN domain-containing protein [Dehalococcoidia bacterium]MYA53016.1 NYN domain-containing protein [Dehalococcoidia bacterium]
MSETTSRFPPGWDEERVRHVIEHYEGQSDDELAAEIETAFEDRSQTVMVIPSDLVPAVRALLSESSGPTPASPTP